MVRAGRSERREIAQVLRIDEFEHRRLVVEMADLQFRLADETADHRHQRGSDSLALVGAIAGLAGYLWVSRYAVAYVEVAQGFELDTVAACVIGGISTVGGIGSVAGAVLGALFLGIVKNALPVIHISPFWQMAISGAVIIVAVVLNARSERRVGPLILKEAQVPA